MEAEPEVLAASVESTSEKKVWPELALRGREDMPAARQAHKASSLALGVPWSLSAFCGSDRNPPPSRGHLLLILDLPCLIFHPFSFRS